MLWLLSGLRSSPVVIHIRWHEPKEKISVNLLKYTNHILQNPFMSSVFLYNGRTYSCNPHQQVLLYLFFYGLYYGQFNTLIRIPTVENKVEVLPHINLSKVLHEISRSDGIKEDDEYTWVLNQIYYEAKQDRMLFNSWNHPRDQELNWLRIKILEIFPHIISELHQSYPKIRLFL